MPSSFEKLMSYIKELQKRYHRAFAAYHVFDSFNSLKAENIVGEVEANQNVKVINSFKDFFLISHEATRVYFFLELAKIFDESKEALQINKIVNFTAARRRQLTVDEFVAYNGDRELLSAIIERYQAISNEDIKALRELLENYRTTIDNLILYRDKWLAHDDLKKPELPQISKGEIEDLFSVIALIINALGKINSESWMWDHVERDARHHTKMVIEHLKRFEPYRLKEIDVEMERMIEKEQARIARLKHEEET